MSAGPLVASGIGILLLVVTAYVLVGGTLATTEVMVEAQGNLAMYQEARMRTAIEIQNTTLSDQTLSVEVKNTGSEPIVDIPLIDVYLCMGNDAPVYVPYGKEDVNYWNNAGIDPDHIHPGQLDPGETLTLSITHEDSKKPTWVQVVTPNGVSSSTYIR
ncbi:MAG TPA: flagellar protein FlaF [Candidatus Methanoculleus thermohydrogenotrophicum]|jgi:flagellar protein FlaF|nr:flagellar protein FlaF [Candidatus Methanoculleus thermohydrogenotrophicum]NLM81674.1 flagellar protein FlaF [Candidatus Methanoculleus thermohydrogenotrophicum]HOB17541.1 flagellar protein FlaF [Candidatus Methanoculleus thermohydrogenotrophicum]HPZ37697.1 flagellar protein FlaF [Candidatus Methanoculleus thermohydrogenotrophicum]HQC90800.1 flagellar protein FlaF [Candidatus Methanoculleus thermohydrogenotrophicum]